MAHTWLGLWLVLAACMVSHIHAHVVLTFPPARKLALDFLDNVRTAGPCGMKKGKGPVTSLVAGSKIRVTWHIAYHHLGGYSLDIMDNYGKIVYRTPSKGYMGAHDTSIVHHMMSLPKGMACVGCSLRIVRQALDWSTSTFFYNFWSCADVDIVMPGVSEPEITCLNGGIVVNGKCRCKRLYAGDNCQFKDDCLTNSDCNNYGRCHNTQSRSYPIRQCFCQAGWYGRFCNRTSLLANKITKYDIYKHTALASGFDLYHRVLQTEQQLEVVLRVKSLSWVAIGFRPLGKDKSGAAEPGTAEPGTAEPGNAEPGTPEPGNAEPGTPEPGNAEPGTPEPGNAEPGTPEPGNAEPGTPEPGNAEPGTPEPGNAEPGTPEPGNAEPGTAEPGNAEPGTAEPGNAEPGTPEPGNAEPGTPEPGNAEPSTPEPGNAEPGTAEPGNAEPGTAEPGNAEPGTPEPGNAEPGTPEPGNAEPGTPEPGNAEPGTPEPGNAEPGTPEPGNAEPGTPEPGNAEPGTAEPGYAKPSTAEPGNAEPGTAEPGNAEPGTPEPGNAEPGTPEPGNAEPGTPEPGNPEPGTPEPGNAEPGTAEPGNAEPGTPEPGNAEPGTAEPGYAEPSTAEPGNAEPGTAEPGNAEPGTAEPGNAEPSTAEPGNAEPSTAEPGNAEPGTAEPGKAKPSTSEPGSAEPGTAEPGKAEPGTAEPGNAEPGTAEPGNAEPGTAEPGYAEPSTAEPGNAKPATAEPGNAEPGTAEPGYAEPSTAEPGNAEPGTPEPGNAEPGTPEPGNAEPGTPEPGNAEPGTPEPGNAEPGTPEPGSAEPGTPEPGSAEPGTPEPGTAEPGTPEPGSSEPGTPEPGNAEPGTPEPGSAEPGTPEPGSAEPGTPEPGSSEPGTPEPGSAEPGTPEPGNAEPGTAEPEGENKNLHPMDRTDIVIGSAWGDYGRVGDYYTRDRSTPQRDEFYGGTPSLTSALAYEEGGNTIVVFRKPLKSTEDTDYDIADGKMHVIWARGQEAAKYKRDELKYHGGPSSQAGRTTINFLAKEDVPDATRSGSWEVNVGRRKFRVMWWYRHEQNMLDFKFSVDIGKSKVWVALGFSSTKAMEDTDAVVAYFDDNGNGVVSDRWASYKAPPPADASQDVTNTSVSQSNGVITVTFSRKAITADTSNDFQFTKTSCPYVIHAVGGGYHSPTGAIFKHPRTPVVTEQTVCFIHDVYETTQKPEPTPRPEPTPAPVAPRNGSWYKLVGGKNFLVFWTYTPLKEQLDFEFSVNIGSERIWVALGFSNDTLMEETDVVVAWMDTGGTWVVSDRWNTAKAAPHPDSSNDLFDTSVSLSGGIITVRFSRMATTADRQRDFTFTATDCPYVMHAIGGGYDSASGAIYKHPFTPVVTEDRVCFLSKSARTISGRTPAPMNNTDTWSPNIIATVSVVSLFAAVGLISLGYVCVRVCVPDCGQHLHINAYRKH